MVAFFGAILPTSITKAGLGGGGGIAGFSQPKMSKALNNTVGDINLFEKIGLFICFLLKVHASVPVALNAHVQISRTIESICLLTD